MEEFVYSGSVDTAADLPDSAPSPGAVLRVVDTNDLFVWTGDHWEQAPDGVVAPYANTNDGFPYVLGTDAVTAYPGVSVSIATVSDDRWRDWRSYRDSKAWFGRIGYVAQFDAGSGAVSAVEVKRGSFGFSFEARNDNNTGTFYWITANNGIHGWLSVRYDLSGRNAMFIQSASEWNLGNAKNYFAGTFFGKVLATQEATRAAATLAVEPEEGPDGELGFDVLALVDALADKITALEARIADLESR